MNALAKAQCDCLSKITLNVQHCIGRLKENGGLDKALRTEVMDIEAHLDDLNRGINELYNTLLCRVVSA